MISKGGLTKINPPFFSQNIKHSLLHIDKKSSQKTPLTMNKPITIKLDNHQFKILSNYRQREVIAIGDQFIHETQSIIFEEFFRSTVDLTGNILILNGAWKDLQYTAIVGTMSLFLVGYTIEGIRVPLGLSGVRYSDKIESF